MNAIIGVGQFCEVHGPSLVFCTQTVFESTQEKLDEFELEDDNSNAAISHNCDGCSSIGIGQALISREDDSSKIVYISTQTPRKKLLRQYLKQACVRSLSCEIGGNPKFDDSCTMCFCDGNHTVLCYTWRVHDAQARGFHRWLTIILLMKDRFMLMSAWPFFVQHIEELVKLLQSEAKNVYEIEQNNGNNRATRLQSGRVPSYAPRSLAHLSGLPTVWTLLHTRFSWILHSASKVLSEIPPVQQCNISNIQATSGNITFRDLYNKLAQENFIALCNCITIGIQVVLRGDENEGALYVRLLSNLLPLGKQFLSHSTNYLTPTECSLLAVGLEVALPKPNQDVFRIEMLSTGWIVKWDGLLPEKRSKLVNSLVRAVSDDRMNIPTLNAHVQSLIIKWNNIARTLQKAGINTLNNRNLLKTFGVGDEDLNLVSNWVHSLQNFNKIKE